MDTVNRRRHTAIPLCRPFGNKNNIHAGMDDSAFVLPVFVQPFSRVGFFFYSGQMGYRFFTFLNGVDAGRESIPSKVTLVCYILCCFFSHLRSIRPAGTGQQNSINILFLFICVCLAVSSRLISVHSTVNDP